jgi:hypothetical protein
MVKFDEKKLNATNIWGTEGIAYVTYVASFMESPVALFL